MNNWLSRRFFCCSSNVFLFKRLCFLDGCWEVVVVCLGSVDGEDGLLDVDGVACWGSGLGAGLRSSDGLTVLTCVMSSSLSEEESWSVGALRFPASWLEDLGVVQWIGSLLAVELNRISREMDGVAFVNTARADARDGGSGGGDLSSDAAVACVGFFSGLGGWSRFRSGP